MNPVFRWLLYLIAVFYTVTHKIKRLRNMSERMPADSIATCNFTTYLIAVFYTATHKIKRLRNKGHFPMPVFPKIPFQKCKIICSLPNLSLVSKMCLYKMLNSCRTLLRLPQYSRGSKLEHSEPNAIQNQNVLKAGNRLVPKSNVQNHNNRMLLTSMEPNIRNQNLQYKTASLDHFIYQ